MVYIGTSYQVENFLIVFFFARVIYLLKHSSRSNFYSYTHYDDGY